MTTQESGLATQPLEGTPPRVTYSIDNGRRVKTVALSLAVVAAVLIYLWHSIQPVNAGVAAAAALVIYGILFFLYNLILWRFPLLNKLDGIPDLRGHWQGTLQYEGGEPAQARMTVIQDWAEVGFELRSALLSSRATMCAMGLADQDAIRVSWNYSHDGTSRLAEGAIEVVLDASRTKLTGTLFDKAGQRGEIEVQRSS